MIFGASNPTSKLSSFASPEATSEKNVKSYDYVIIGGGTAGSVLASRLSENPKVSVLVIEAGTDNAGVLESKIPLMFNKLFHTKRDWDYFTAPQANVMSRELYWPRGKLLGGSSSLNAMMYSHPAPCDVDLWAQKLGCKGWGYSDIAPYLRKAEKYSPNSAHPILDLEHRGDSGFWHTGHNGHLNEVSEKGFLGACSEIGIKSVEDINTPKGLLGAVKFMTFIDPTGQRSSAATAYLPNEVRSRPNLTIGVETLVTKVLLRTGNGEPVAYGVELQGKKDGPLYKVHASKEVVLCGGAVNTPQTLKLSGIGPAAEIASFGLPVFVDSPHVGENLLDHFCTSSMAAKAKPGVTMNYLGSTIRALPSLAQWMLTGKGPLTSNIGEAAAFARSQDEAKRFGWKVPEDNCSGSDGPDLELIAAPLAFINHGEGPTPDGEDALTIIPIGLRPKSRGVIRLRSDSVWDKPLIDPRYWSDPEDNDRKVLLVGMRICLKLLASEAYAPFLEKVPPSSDINNFYWPWCDPDHDSIPDEKLLAWAGRTAFTLYHPVSSCRMRNSIDEGVVDTNLNVHGVKGLRVCDASVFPDQISTHPTALVIGMAERCADLIQGKQPLSQSSTARL